MDEINFDAKEIGGETAGCFFDPEKAKVGLIQTDGKPATIRGTGIIYNELSGPWPNPQDGKILHWRLLPGSATPWKDVRCLVQHERGKLLGRSGNGTMRLFPTATGVDFECDPADTTLGRDTAALLARQDLMASSVSIYLPSVKGKITTEGDKRVITVESFIYKEISIVDEGNFASATAELLNTDNPVDETLKEAVTIEPVSEVQNSSQIKKDYSVDKTKLQLAELQRQSIARAFAKGNLKR